MSVNIAILNTHGVALAADSAATVDGPNKKVYHTAEKLFMLTKRQPIGLMIFGIDSFMGIDWILIIKEYRRIKGDESFSTLLEYVENFFNFINDHNFFTPKQQIRFLQSMADEVFKEIKKDFIALLKDELQEEEEVQDSQIIKIFNKNIKQWFGHLKDVKGEELFKVDEDFIKANRAAVDEVMTDVFENYKALLTNKQKNDLLTILIQDIQKCCTSDDYDYPSMVIAGYGNDEVMPSLFSFDIYGKLGSSLVYQKSDNVVISVDPIGKGESDAFIYPFSDTSMANTFLGGIDPDFDGKIRKQFSRIMDKLADIVDAQHKEKLGKIEELYGEYLDTIKHHEYSKPIMNNVTHLKNRDLAEMAESLVNITSFKRHMSIDEDSETVGGPTDVALITKGDGFIWIKHKNYFDINLNKHYIDNYYGEEQDG